MVAEFARKHGAPPGRGASVVAMGSLGAGRLTATSDLDLIVIFDAGDVESSDGPRPLATRSYFARLTQALVTALSAPMAEGRLYEVDMRLRPSGRQGPVATSLAAYTAYQSEEAWTWEHLALTRARPIAGDAELLADIDAFRCKLLSRPRNALETLRDVGEMRRRLAEAKPALHWLDVNAGAGGLQDIDFLAQAGCLLAGQPERRLSAQIEAAQAPLDLTSEEVTHLKSAASLFWTVRTATRLVFGNELTPDIETGATGFLMRVTGKNSLEALETTLSEARQSVAEIVTGRLQD